MASNVDTATLEWDTPPDYRNEMKLQKMFKSFPVRASPRSKYTSKKYQLTTSPNKIPLEVQLVLICHPDPDPSMELILLNQSEDDLVATVEIESNIIDWDVEEMEGDDSSVVFPLMLDAYLADEDINEEIISARRQLGHRFGRTCQTQNPPATILKKRLVNIKMASKKRTVLCEIEGKHRPPYLFKLSFFFDDQFTKAARSMGVVEKLLASGIEKDFTIICRPDEDTLGHGQEESFLVHKEVLSCRSDVFEAMMSHGMQEARTNTLILTDITIGALKDVLLFIYTDKVSNLEEHAKELLSAGDKFLLTKMKRMAEKHLMENLNLSTVLEVVAHAYLHNSEVLVETASFFIVKHFDCIMHEPKWAEFVREQPGLLIQILKKIPLCYTHLPVENKSEATSSSDS